MYFTHKFPINLASKIRLLVLDVDGVLTDGGLYYSNHDEAEKRFHVHDGLGIRLAQDAGIIVGVITGLKSGAVEKRIQALRIVDYYAGYIDKRGCLLEMKEKYALDWQEIAYIGDDWVDLSVMQQVGLPLAVANAQVEVKEIAKYTAKLSGGNGAVRELIREILIAQGKYEESLRSWSSPC